MNAEELKAMQAPLKEKYREIPESASYTLTATGMIVPDAIACKVETGLGTATTGLHPAAGGDGNDLCSGDMLLEALVGCAGVTLKAVATAMQIELKSGMIKAEGDLDFRGTLGVDKTAPMGFSDIRLNFKLDSDEEPEKLKKLIELTERYCVIYQTLKNSPTLTSKLS